MIQIIPRVQYIYKQISIIYRKHVSDVAKPPSLIVQANRIDNPVPLETLRNVRRLRWNHPRFESAITERKNGHGKAKTEFRVKLAKLMKKEHARA